MKTRVTELLGIKYPIIQGAMGLVSDSPAVVCAVSDAGGMGILAATDLSPEGMRENIRMIKELSDKPFGVNILPAHPEYVRMLEIMVEEEAPVMCHGRGNPWNLIKLAKSGKIMTLPTVGAVKHAIKAEADGADAIIVTGTEGGGHTSYIGTMMLIPAVVDKVSIPVIAGGGIADPRQFVAALALGAEGIEMGTRFMVTQESPVHENVKQKLVEASEEEVWATHQVTGRYQRGLLNKFRRQFLNEGPDHKGVIVDKLADKDYLAGLMTAVGKAFVDGDVEDGSISCGQGVGLINDIPTIPDLIKRFVQEAEKIYEGMKTSIPKWSD